MEEDEEEEEAPISIHSHSQFFFQGRRAFEPLPSSYTWKRQCRRRMAGWAFARSKFNRLVPLAHLPPPLQWVSPSDRWDGAGPLIEPHLIAKEGPSPSENSHSLLFSAALPLPCGDKEEGGGGLSWAASEIKFSGGRGTKKKGHKMGSPTTSSSSQQGGGGCRGRGGGVRREGGRGLV